MLELRVVGYFSFGGEVAGEDVEKILGEYRVEICSLKYLRTTEYQYTGWDRQICGSIGVSQLSY